MASFEQLFSALNALYTSQDAKMRQEADKWLEQWQEKTEAWSVCDAVLHDPNSPLEAKFYCAQAREPGYSALIS